MSCTASANPRSGAARTDRLVRSGGVAYLAARQPAEAAGEFQTILGHRSIVLVDPMDAMARLQLARALVLSGETVKAKSAYNDLFAPCKDADPKIPFVNEARENSSEPGPGKAGFAPRFRRSN